MPKLMPGMIVNSPKVRLIKEILQNLQPSPIAPTEIFLKIEIQSTYIKQAYPSTRKKMSLETLKSSRSS